MESHVWISPKSEDCDEEVEHNKEAQDLKVDSNLATETSFDLLHGSVPDIAVLEGPTVPAAGLLQKQSRKELAVLHRRIIRAEMRPSVDAPQ